MHFYNQLAVHSICAHKKNLLVHNSCSCSHFSQNATKPNQRQMLPTDPAQIFSGAQIYFVFMHLPHFSHCTLCVCMCVVCSNRHSCTSGLRDHDNNTSSSCFYKKSDPGGDNDTVVCSTLLFSPYCYIILLA